MKRMHFGRVAAVAVFAAVLGAAVSAHAAPAKPLVTEQAVSTVGNTDGGFTDVYGSKVVYDERTGYGDFDVWMFDSATMTSPKRIASSSYNDRYPRIYGDYVVYARNYAGVYLYRISKGTTKTLVSSGAQSQFVDIYKNKVVYSKYSSVTKSLDVYVYDIATGKESKIVSGKDSDGGNTDDRVQSIWGDNVVYVADFKDLRVYNMATKKSVSLDAQGFSVDFDSSDVRKSRPAIYQNTVAYVANVSNVNQVFTYDLASNVRTQVSVDATTHANPAIYGTRVVYESGSIGKPKLVMYDLKAKTSWPLEINGGTFAMQPSIWGDRLAWSDLRNATLNGDEMDEGANWNNEDIYTGTLNTLKITASGPSVVEYSAPSTFTATVKKPDGSVADTTPVTFEVSTDNVNWTAISNTETVAGSATATMAATPSKRYVRFWFGGNAAPGNPLPPTVSNVITVMPKVSLGTPVAPKTMKKSKYYTIYGSLKPKHAKGTKPVRVYKYKKVSGKWKSYGYVKATASDYNGYTRYKVKMRLTSKGSWRLRAYAPADSSHAATWSSKYDYVTVK